MTESNLSRAYALFRRAAVELEVPDVLALEELAARLRAVSNRVLDALEGHDLGDDDPFSRLERHGADIANDLRRVERLMKDRLSGRE